MNEAEKTYTLDELVGDKTVEEPKDREKPKEPPPRLFHWGAPETLCGLIGTTVLTGAEATGRQECPKCREIKASHERFVEILRRRADENVRALEDAFIEHELGRKAKRPWWRFW